MIDKMGNYPIFDSPTTVYKLNGYSLQELLSQFWKKIQDCIEDVNIAMEFMKWIKEVGLPEEVVKYLNEMYEDGRLGDLINDVLLGGINNKVDNAITDFNDKYTLLDEELTAHNISNDNKFSEIDENLSKLYNKIGGLDTLISIEMLRTFNTDDTWNGAIEKAKELLPTGGTILFGNRTYLIGDIDIPSNIKLKGNITEFKKVQDALSIINIVGNNVEIEGITFINDTSNSSYSRETHLIKITGNNTKIVKCKFNKNEYTQYKDFFCIYITSKASDTLISDCLITNGAHMIFISEGAKNITITNNRFKGGWVKGVISGNLFTTTPEGDCIKISRGFAGENIIVTNNIFEDIFRDCIDCFTNGYKLIFTGNLCINIDTVALDIKTIYRDANDPNIDYGTSNPSKPSNSFIITGNEFINCGLKYSDSCVIHIINSDYTVAQNMKSEFGIQDVIVSDNIITNNPIFGIRITRAQNVKIHGNIFKGIGSRCIYVTDECNRITIENNTLELMNGGRGINVVGASSYNIAIKDNLLTYKGTGNTSEGLSVYGSKHFVKNNVFVNCRISLVLNANNSVIEGNEFIDCNYRALNINETCGNFIVNNNFHTCERGIICLGLLSGSIIKDNKYINCPQIAVDNNADIRINYEGNTNKYEESVSVGLL